MHQNPRRSRRPIPASRSRWDTPERAIWPPTIDVSGSIKALKSVQISAKTNGRVVSVPFREGDSSASGQVVVQQDTSDASDQVRIGRGESSVGARKAVAGQNLGERNRCDDRCPDRFGQAALDGAKARLEPGQERRSDPGTRTGRERSHDGQGELTRTRSRTATECARSSSKAR